MKRRHKRSGAVRFVASLRRCGRNFFFYTSASFFFGRMFAASTRFRKRILCGVTSTSSSSAINSSACSNDNSFGGTSRIASSAVEARMFVSFFSFIAFTSRSTVRAFSPTIIPSYTFVPGLTNSVPRSWRLKSAYVVVSPVRSATSEPVDLPRRAPQKFSPPQKHRVQQACSLRLSEKLIPKPDQPARRRFKLETNAPSPVIHHLCHLPLASPERLRNHADELVWTIDDDRFDWFENVAVDLPRDRLRLRHLKLVTFAPHHFDEDR